MVMHVAHTASDGRRLRDVTTKIDLMFEITNGAREKGVMERLQYVPKGRDFQELVTEREKWTAPTQQTQSGCGRHCQH